MQGNVAPNNLMANPNQPPIKTSHKANDNITTTTKENCKRLVQIERASMAVQRLYELEKGKRRKV